MRSILLYLVCLLFLPTLPCSADLFSPSQPVTDLSSSLDNFNWDFDVGASSTSPSQLPPLQSLTPFSSISCRSLSTPQKRLNHIMSEQKRRNAIRDGYAQLIALIGSAGAQTIDLPSRGRPKGGGTNSEGKSGVLFRAIEYCRWPEEGGDTLKEEVLRLEADAEGKDTR
ncbi:hypothetical protein SCLCIDRAFT_13161 [Scleroderma citrinum Foug A]|uniref:BHLH domain-containing protein n=1 Tax=Scleroderma citrinum Foug A TaxID=1036808 RepID=A0A0C3EPM4_9AGAM|nr:hypothetical protein SCLCIDRAFT_13161 [Scleroderma citrinum Foug A]